MLETIPVQSFVLVKIGGINEVIIPRGNGIIFDGTLFGKAEFFRVLHHEDFFLIHTQVVAKFIPDVGTGVPIASDLAGFFAQHGAMIRCYDDSAIAPGQIFHHFKQRGMFKPGAHESAEGGFVGGGKFLDHQAGALLSRDFSKHIAARL